jgi:hypothetical protein
VKNNEEGVLGAFSILGAVALEAKDVSSQGIPDRNKEIIGTHKEGTPQKLPKAITSVMCLP